MTYTNDGNKIFKNDEDNHLYDSERPFHAKDDVRELNKWLRMLGNFRSGSRFDLDSETNPSGKMRCSLHSGRADKNGRVYSPKHNDRNFDSNPENIIKDKTGKNITWCWCGDDCTFDEAELKFYEQTFKAQLDYTNAKYRKNRHLENIKTMDQWRKIRNHAPEEQIYQIGKMENHPEIEKSVECFREYLEWINDWNMDHDYPFTILDWALHQDEQGAPHFQMRKVWIYNDPETGLVTTNQTQALLEAGIQLPDPTKKIGRKNNPKITFDAFCRAKWISIVRSHGLEIEDNPKPKRKSGMTLNEYKKQQEDFLNQVYLSIVEITKKNIDVCEKIGEWEEIYPDIGNFEEFIQQKVKEARASYDPEEREKIVKAIVSVFAKSLHYANESYQDSKRNLEKSLYGFNGHKNGMNYHQFGAEEFKRMFCESTPETLERIAASMRVSGYKDVSEWISNKKGWFRNFQYGKEIERELSKDRGMEY